MVAVELAVCTDISEVEILWFSIYSVTLEIKDKVVFCLQIELMVTLLCLWGLRKNLLGELEGDWSRVFQWQLLCGLTYLSQLLQLVTAPSKGSVKTTHPPVLSYTPAREQGNEIWQSVFLIIMSLLSGDIKHGFLVIRDIISSLCGDNHVLFKSVSSWSRSSERLLRPERSICDRS